VRVRIDESRCQGHAMCSLYAPKVFAQTDDDGSAYVLVDQVDGHTAEAAVLAAASCPEKAITLDR
jgi:ferredoxin